MYTHEAHNSNKYTLAKRNERLDSGSMGEWRMRGMTREWSRMGACIREAHDSNRLMKRGMTNTLMKREMID